MDSGDGCLQCRLLPQGLCEEHYAEFQTHDHVWAKGRRRAVWSTLQGRVATQTEGGPVGCPTEALEAKTQ